MARELINQYVSDSVVFRFPLFYNKRLPDQTIRDAIGVKAPKHQTNDAFAPNILGLSQPKPALPVHLNIIMK